MPIERSAESAERSLLGMHSMDMDDDEEEGNDGSGFLIRRSKRRRRDGDHRHVVALLGARADREPRIARRAVVVRPEPAIPARAGPAGSARGETVLR